MALTNVCGYGIAEYNCEIHSMVILAGGYELYMQLVAGFIEAGASHREQITNPFLHSSFGDGSAPIRGRL